MAEGTKVSLKNSEISGVLEGLQALSKIKISATKALKVRALVREISGYAEDAEEVRKQIIERHTEKDANGEPVAGETEGTVKLKDFKAFAAELGELMDASFEVSPVHLSWFGKDEAALEALDVEPEVFIKLGDLLLVDVE